MFRSPLNEPDSMPGTFSSGVVIQESPKVSTENKWSNARVKTGTGGTVAYGTNGKQSVFCKNHSSTITQKPLLKRALVYFMHNHPMVLSQATFSRTFPTETKSKIPAFIAL